MPRRVAWQLSLVGILFMSANNVLLIWGETKVPSGYASLVIAMIPILVALIETALPGGENLNLRGWIGTFLGAASACWHRGCGPRCSYMGHRNAAPESDGRSALRVSSSLTFWRHSPFATSARLVCSRRFHFRVDTFAATTWQIGSASVVNLIIATAAGKIFRTRGVDHQRHSVYSLSGYVRIGRRAGLRMSIC